MGPRASDLAFRRHGGSRGSFPHRGPARGTGPVMACYRRTAPVGTGNVICTLFAPDRILIGCNRFCDWSSCNPNFLRTAKDLQDISCIRGTYFRSTPH